MIPRMPTVSKITGTGSYLPERVLTNHDLEKMVETSDAWIRERTGIARRHLARPDEKTTDLALIASRDAIAKAGLEPKDIEAIVFATVTPDQVMPAAGCTLQAKLGCGQIMAFDLSAACSGFVYGLNVADGFIRMGQYKHVLVVGAESLSRIVNWKDRETCILFGDGAGAVVLSAAEADGKDSSQFYSFSTRANGTLGHLLSLDTGRPDDQMLHPESMKMPYVHMRGREIFKSAVRAMADSCEAVLKANGLTNEDVDWVIPHQANIRIIQAVGDLLKIDPKKIIINIEETGNVSSATIPVAFDQAVGDGRIKRGHTVLFTAFGGGLTYGATVFKY
jgi:3-oxoacyl-[acyl-carrier-protein] synthase-3